MKKIKLLVVLCFFISITSQAQFPAPRSFWMSYRYITINDDNYCCGKWLSAPAHCEPVFGWELPELSGTDMQLAGYNVYFYYTKRYYEGMEIPFSEAKIIAYITDPYNPYLHTRCGDITDTGIAWVTAVYSNPEGESEPSNIVFSPNAGIPIAIRKVEQQPFSLTCNKQKNGIEIHGLENITSLRIFRLDGTEIAPGSASDFRFIDTKDLAKGVYVVRITTGEGGVISEKIVIE